MRRHRQLSGSIRRAAQRWGLVALLGIGGCCWPKPPPPPPCPELPSVPACPEFQPKKSCLSRPAPERVSIKLERKGCPANLVCLELEEGQKLSDTIANQREWIEDATTACGAGPDGGAPDLADAQVD